jgi:NADPH-dependent F420 reductase
MRIAIIGAGNVGNALGGGWASAGHEIVFGVRDPNDAKVQGVVRSVGGRARAETVRDAVAQGDIVTLATPWAATKDALTAAGSLSGKILVDATNPLTPDLSGLVLGHTTSAAEQVAAWTPGAKVVKAFNTIGAQHMTNPRFGDQRASMFLCGDDAAAKQVVAGLATALGFEPVDAGPLTQARLLEPLALLWISMVYAYGQGPNIAFRLIRK